MKENTTILAEVWKALNVFLGYWDRNYKGPDKDGDDYLPVTHEFLVALGGLRVTLARMDELLSK